MKQKQLDDFKEQVRGIANPLGGLKIDAQAAARGAACIAQEAYREAATRGENENVLRRLLGIIEARAATAAVTKRTPTTAALDDIARGAKRHEKAMIKKYGARWKIESTLEGK